MSTALETILEKIDNAKLVELLRDSVEQYSPSYAEEPAMTIFADRLSEGGVRYMRQPIPDSGSPRVITGPI